MKGAFAERKSPLATILTTERLRMGISQGEMADLLGVSKFSVIGWELGRNKPFKKNLKKISEVLDVSEEYLSSKEYQKLLPWVTYDKQRRGRAYCPYCGRGQDWSIREAEWNGGRIPKYCEWCGRETLP